MGGIIGAILGFMLTTIFDFSSYFPAYFNNFWVFALTIVGAFLGYIVEHIIEGKKQCIFWGLHKEVWK